MLNGFFLSFVVDEMKNQLCNSYVNKIYQTSKDEVVLYFRTLNSSKKFQNFKNLKLLINVGANLPRVGLIEQEIENPVQPTMFCMLLRKYLSNAKLLNVSQHGFERILFFDFETFDEVKDKIYLRLIVEIMGRHSNLILTFWDPQNSDFKNPDFNNLDFQKFDSKNLIIDSIKRIGFNISRKRQVLPKLEYSLPPNQSKLNLLTNNIENVVKKILSLQTSSLQLQSLQKLFSQDFKFQDFKFQDFKVQELNLKNSLVKSLEGMSPHLADQILSLAFSKDLLINELETAEFFQTEIQKRLIFVLEFLKFIVINKQGRPLLFLDSENKPKYFSFFDFKNFDLKNLFSQDFSSQDFSIRDSKVCLQKSFSSLVEMFYQKKSNSDRTTQITKDLSDRLNNLLGKLNNKLELQKQEKLDCQDKEKIQQFAILLQSNLHKINRNSKYIILENFFDDNKEIRIDLDVRLSGPENAQKYFNKYKKLSNANKMLDGLIVNTQNEIMYIESVLESLERIKNSEDLIQIKLELQEQGYMKFKKNNLKFQNQKSKKTDKLRTTKIQKTTSVDGFEILIGNNNVSNDWLTFRHANKNDIWFHVQKTPGAHVVVVTGNKDLPDSTLQEAAKLAAQNSKAKENSSVAVDYTLVKHVKKFKGAKPGMVIYDNYKTITIKL